MYTWWKVLCGRGSISIQTRPEAKIGISNATMGIWKPGSSPSGLGSAGSQEVWCLYYRTSVRAGAPFEIKSFGQLWDSTSGNLSSEAFGNFKVEYFGALWSVCGCVLSSIIREITLFSSELQQELNCCWKNIWNMSCGCKQRCSDSKRLFLNNTVQFASTRHRPSTCWNLDTAI